MTGTVKVNTGKNRNRFLPGSKNWSWRGNNARPSSLHEWVSIHKPRPNLCEKCNKCHPEELSFRWHGQIKYTRNPEDYRWLCKPCHDRMDRRKLTRYQVERVRQFYACGFSQRDLAKTFKVCNMTIWHAVNKTGGYKND